MSNNVERESISAKSSTARFIKRDYWNEHGNHRPYRNMVHDENDEARFQLCNLDELLECVEDGEEFEITVRPTRRRPFGERRYRYQRAHTYEPETDEQMAERLRHSKP